MTQRDKQHEALESKLRDLALRIDKISTAQNSTRTSAQNAEQDKYKSSLDEKLLDITNRLSVMEVSAPPELRALSRDTVKAAVKADPYVYFEVLKDWGAPGGSYHFRQGDQLRADHHTGIAGYVESGLLLGVPSEQGAQINQLRAQSSLRIA